MPFPRSSGILLHPTSFPSRYGIGDLGIEAYYFIDFLVRSGQRYWQILPLNPPSVGNSPYMSFSAIAGNPLLISPDLLLEKGLLNPEDLENVPDFPLDHIDFEGVIAWKIPLLKKASQNFAQKASPVMQRRFEGFCQGKAGWLEDYALFMALLESQGQPVWTQWPIELRNRYQDALDYARQELKEEIFFHKFLQFEFLEEWLALRGYINTLNIQIIGDIPIYVGHNSADVWANPQVFKLDPETGNPLEVAGVPPDYFSATGQLWGNPIYDWEYLQNTGFDWWVRRVREVLTQVDIVRIDHFRGLESYWSVPAGETTAMNGQWVKAPGYALFDTIRTKLGKLPIIAEDLGDIDQPVLDMRDHYEFPGMKILHFAFGGGSDNPYLPFNVDRNSVIYTGTHDNNTSMGWYYDNANDYEKGRLYQYLGCTGDYSIAWDMIRLAYSSVANQAIIPLQDVFSLGSDARMNTPSLADGNWSWRYRGEALTEEYINRLREMVMLYGR
ncbi:4-alpha-glucanotransferase [Gloeothece citriformis PCC 7424]|uniref:4-alpha-glucanotransferase n=1 Tax=Gloeothece citriformis (strain PCC 7424) TaxID=65393 RepID=B7KFI5_GLOC7|nr:4-alpha-glucanotransferase [Gloeothece citriformis]ACK73310.1 4-alpha-glucanotransferase [Gloeothece citriformis PCC 7424]